NTCDDVTQPPQLAPFPPPNKESCAPHDPKHKDCRHEPRGAALVAFVLFPQYRALTPHVLSHRSGLWLARRLRAPRASASRRPRVVPPGRCHSFEGEPAYLLGLHTSRRPHAFKEFPMPSKVSCAVLTHRTGGSTHEGRPRSESAGRMTSVRQPRPYGRQ